MSVSQIRQENIDRTTASNKDNERILGLDFARGLAIIGMILIHFRMVIADSSESSAMTERFFELLDGRPTMLFMLLAGIGFHILTRKANGDDLLVSKTRRRLVKRGAFLFAIACINLAIWPGDILRVYGISFMVGAFIFHWPAFRLIILSLLIFGIYVLLLLTLNIDLNRDYETWTYNNLWTPVNLVRNLFFDGERSVLPWMGIFILGILLGRLPLQKKRIQFLLVGIGLCIWLATEMFSFIAIEQLYPLMETENGQEAVLVFAGTRSFPCLPMFIVSSFALAICIIGTSLLLCESLSDWRLVKSMISTGQLAFTNYLLHIYVVIFIAYVLEWSQQPTKTTVIAALIYVIAMMVISLLWGRKGKRGPMEYLLRRVCG